MSDSFAVCGVYGVYIYCWYDSSLLSIPLLRLLVLCTWCTFIGSIIMVTQCTFISGVIVQCTEGTIITECTIYFLGYYSIHSQHVFVVLSQCDFSVSRIIPMY